MKKRFLSLAACVLAGALLAAGCAPSFVESETREPVPFDTYYFERFGPDVMPIGGYIGPTKGFGYQGMYMESQITDYHFGLVREAGVNFIAGMKPDFNAHPQETLDSLKYADRNDVMYFVRDNYLFDLQAGKSPVNRAEFEARIKNYSDYASFAGIVGKDEPFGNEFAACAEVLDLFDEVFGPDSNKQLYMNSLSYQCPPDWLGAGPDGGVAWDLDTYMTEWFKAFDTLGYYSFDLYPFVGAEDSLNGNYFKNLSLAKKYAEENGVPFWTFIQAGGNFGGDSSWRIVNEGELLWQVNTSLAYGAKGYQFYPYNWPPESLQEGDYDEGLVNREGKKTPTYFYAQKANRQTAACDHVLMNSYCFGVMERGSIGLALPEEDVLTEFRELTSLSGDAALVGCFDHRGKTALYVVNNSITKDRAKVKLHFDASYRFDVIQRGQTRTNAGETLELTFAPGEGALVTLY